MHLPHLPYRGFHHFIDGDQLHTILLATLARGMEADPAIKTFIDDLRRTASRPPFHRTRRAEQPDYRRSYGGGNVHGARVVADKERRTLEQHRQCSDIGTAGDVQRSTLR